jgi:hypothetical protein
MNPDPRDLLMRREKGQALIRALHLSELQAAGAARSLALHEADGQLDRIARVLPDALTSGVSLAEIARITNVSRPTLYELRGRYTDDSRDLTFAVISAIAGRRGPIDSDGVAEHLKRPRDEVAALVKHLIEHDMVDQDFIDGPDGAIVELYLTEKAFSFLEAWDFEERTRDQGGDED